MEHCMLVIHGVPVDFNIPGYPPYENSLNTYIIVQGRMQDFRTGGGGKVLGLHAKKAYIMGQKAPRIGYC